MSQVAPKPSAEFPVLLAFNYYTFMCTCNFYKYEHVYT